LYVGKIPEKVILGVVHTETLNGKIDSDPFCFLDHNISSVSLTTNSDNGLITHRLTLDSKAGLFLECYRSLLTLVPSLDLGNALSRDAYMNGEA
jgi:hypothetical protein